MTNAIATAITGEKVFAGPVDDPFFVDLAGAFDVGNFRPEGNATNPTKDGLARFNVHSIAIKVPISSLQKDGKTTAQATSILDGDFVIGVWASASRQQIKTCSDGSGTASFSGNWVQVSRLGMPLTNEASYSYWSKRQMECYKLIVLVKAHLAHYFNNPELALYMDDSQFGGAVPVIKCIAYSIINH